MNKLIACRVKIRSVKAGSADFERIVKNIKVSAQFEEDDLLRIDMTVEGKTFTLIKIRANMSEFKNPPDEQKILLYVETENAGEEHVSDGKGLSNVHAPQLPKNSDLPENTKEMKVMLNVKLFRDKGDGGDSRKAEVICSDPVF